MKSLYSLFLIFMLIISSFSIQVYGQKDSTQVRYMKFSTTVNGSYTRIALQEIKAFSGGQNIAPDGTISVNSKTYDSNVNAIKDDNTTTAWFSDDYASLTSDNGVGPTLTHPHFIVVDLGDKYSLESLKLDLTGGWSFDYTFDFLVSEDSSSWSLVDSKIKSHDLYTYTSIPLQKVRYIKYACYYSSDYGQVNVQEIQAYSNGVNVALNKSVYANSYEWGNATSNGKNAVDGNSGSRWSSNRNDHISATAAESAPVVVNIDLGAVQTVDSIQLTYNSSTIFNLSISTDGSEWMQVDNRLNDLNQYSYLLTHKMIINTALVSVSDGTVQWVSTANSNGNPAIINRGICWSTTSQPTVSDTKTVNGDGDGQFTSTMTGLTNNTIYYARGYVTNINGTQYSKEKTFLAGLCIQTNPVTNISRTTANSGGFVSANGVQINSRGLCWATSPQPTTANDYQENTTDSAEFSSLLTNLTADTKYYVRAYAVTNQGTFYGNECSFRYQNQQYQANSDGFFPNEIFTETDQYNGQVYYTSNNGYTLYFDGNSWLMGDFVSSADSGNPPLTGWWDGTVLTAIIQATTAANVTCDTYTLNESISNNGSFKETITFTHDNASGNFFGGDDNEDFIKTGKAIVRNLPEGLTAILTRTNQLSLTLSLTGNAKLHSSQNDISNLKVMLLAGAFSNGTKAPTNGSIVEILLKFIDPVTITVTDTKSSSDYSIGSGNNIILEKNAVFSINQTTAANQLTIKAGAHLNLSQPITLNNLILQSDDNNSFCSCQSANFTVTGTIMYEKVMNDSTRYFLSFPCNVKVADIRSNRRGKINNDFYIYEYDGASRATSGQAESWTAISSGTLLAYKGYAFELKTNTGNDTLTFTLDNAMVQNVSEVAAPVSYFDGNLGNNHKGWNLIGQPYLSKFTSAHADIPYLTTHCSNVYTGRTNSSSCTLNPFEAFFVQVANSGTVPFYLAGKQTIKSQVSQDISQGLQLNLTTTVGSDFSSLILDDAQTTGYEIGQDLEKWLSTNSSQPQIYTLMNGIKYAYNALPEGSVQDLFIGFYCKIGGAATLSATQVNVPDLSKLILTDHQTGSSTDLATGSYQFTAATGVNNNRFSISIQRVVTNMTSTNALQTPTVSIVHSLLSVSHLPANASVRLYNATGKQLASETVQSDNYQKELQQSGMYIIQIQSSKGNYSYKLINP